jgi:alkylation response protein AidB-like acyl-CoA dehydrogenase
MARRFLGIAATGPIPYMSPETRAMTIAASALPSTDPVLSDDVLIRCDERAAGYDRENAFFTEDFEDLKEAGYLTLPVPQELGGQGLALDGVAREQRRLAYYAAPTALAINMHLYWLGVAADLWRAGDTSLQWILEEAMNGQVFAAGHAESGNDVPLLLSTTTAERVDGGYRFTGHKAFGSLTPVWSFFGVHGIDASDPAAPKIVHAFLPRNTEGYAVRETWDTLGMRATRSDDTILDGAFIPDRYVARVVPAGAAGIDHFVLAVLAWALVGFGNIYYGMARRALDMTLDSVKKKKSVALSRSMAYHPEVQHAVAEMGIELESVEPHLDRIASDWASGAPHGAMWPAKIFAAKYHAVESSWRVVDKAMDLGGGFGIFRRAGLERLFRDARLGRIHPANSMFTHEIVGKSLLGINPDEAPRWG